MRHISRHVETWPMEIEERASDLVSADAVRRLRPSVRYRTERDGRTFRSFWIAYDANTPQAQSVFLMNVRVACELGFSRERLSALQMEEL